jgi:class 3 adenylate cyclase/dihydrofolate reductase
VRKLVVSEFVTLDGVMEAPGFEEHRAGRNAWALRVQDAESQQFALEQVLDAGALLMGRTTYEIWAAFWPSAGGDEAFARRMNEIPKFVVSSTLDHLEWSNSTLLRADLAASLAELKRQPGGDILVYGSADLVAELVQRELVDEYRLMLFPVILGAGKHLFRDEIDTRHLRLVGTRPFRSGIVLLTYQPELAVPESPYLETYAWNEEQIRSLQAAQDTDRVLATVLFTDIVESTARAAELGDREWRRLLDRHDEAARSEVERWHGQLIKTTGDGILATFDTPTRAIRCAFSFRETIARLGLEIRAAIHTGEIDRRGEDIGGLCVHIAARALMEASIGAVVVTRTVRDVASGIDLEFTPLGSVGLRGVPGQWELFGAAVA